MIEQLEYSVRFPPNDRFPLGQSFERKLDFEAGVTLITGPNEIGKTLNLEIAEFLLFGTAALRGKADDYKGLRASGKFWIRGERYKIERTARNAAISQAATVLAVGTKPVNARILQLLGYGLDVFRIANVANQNDAERLSEMLPAARKAMVDKLIGADQIETLAKRCGEEALGVSREANGLELGLGPEPFKPVQPEGYHLASEVEEKVRRLRADRDRAVELRAFLANQPVVPALGDRPHRHQMLALERAERVLQLRTYDFDLEAARAQDAAYQIWLERQAFEKRMPARPKLGLGLLEDLERAERLERELEGLRASPELVCPCGKPFRTTDGEIARVQLALGNLPMKPPGVDLVVERDAHRTWDREEVRVMWERLSEAVETEKPAHHPREAEGAVPCADVVAELEKLGFGAGADLVGVRGLMTMLRAWEAQQSAHADALARKEAWDLQATAAQMDLNRIRLDVEDKLARTEIVLNSSRLYEANMASYQQAFISWAQGQDRLTDLRREERSWRNAKTAMNALREETKTHLVPSLSRVASHLLTQMTGGARGRIVVDEDFEVEVDGQPLATLSGSGKICANLALRLGLGRILTNGVFPVFMGDEMDASMDAQRSQCLYDALRALEGKLTQILIVTHKPVAAARTITLEA